MARRDTCGWRSTSKNDRNQFHGFVLCSKRKQDLIYLRPLPGTAVYTYFICANTLDDATTLTNLTFALDGGQVGTFVHVPEATSDYEYNILGYAGTNLSNGRHQLLIQTTGDVNNSLVLFDYLIYSYGSLLVNTMENRF